MSGSLSQLRNGACRNLNWEPTQKHFCVQFWIRSHKDWSLNFNADKRPFVSQSHNDQCAHPLHWGLYLLRWPVHPTSTYADNLNIKLSLSLTRQWQMYLQDSLLSNYSALLSEQLCSLWPSCTRSWDIAGAFLYSLYCCSTVIQPHCGQLKSVNCKLCRYF